MGQHRAAARGTLQKRPFRKEIWRLGRSIALVCALAAPFVGSAAMAQTGTSTGLRIPRYVSLKSDRVNLREGPSKDHRTTWVFQRTGLPVEITAESENWRRIRDSEGSEGWVLQSLLSGKRTALVAPWRRGDLFVLLAKPNEGADHIAKLQAGVQTMVKKCDAVWCRVSGQGFDGYLQKALLWGVYPDDVIE